MGSTTHHSVQNQQAPLDTYTHSDTLWLATEAELSSAQHPLHSLARGGRRRKIAMRDITARSPQDTLSFSRRHFKWPVLGKSRSSSHGGMSGDEYYMKSSEAEEEEEEEEEDEESKGE